VTVIRSSELLSRRVPAAIPSGAPVKSPGVVFAIEEPAGSGGAWREVGPDSTSYLPTVHSGRALVTASHRSTPGNGRHPDGALLARVRGGLGAGGHALLHRRTAGGRNW
jgi:hypothetical protein